MVPVGYAAAMVLQDGPNASVRADLQHAVEQVQAIVNQPVASYPKSDDAQVGFYSPGWFHPGAIKPDFKHVDVRASQELQYSRFLYVTSDLNPGVMFRGEDCEFNAMTKWAYLDRTLPKKRLTEMEMIEINRLYRVIGACEEKLAATPQGAVIGSLPAATASSVAPDDSWTTYAPYAGGAVVLLLILLVLVRRRS